MKFLDLLIGNKKHFVGIQEENYVDPTYRVGGGVGWKNEQLWNIYPHLPLKKPKAGKYTIVKKWILYVFFAAHQCFIIFFQNLNRFQDVPSG